MPLAHFIAEAKKHTPLLSKRIVEGRTTIAQTDEHPAFERKDLKRTMAVISEGDKAVAEAEQIKKPTWHTCKYLKNFGEREMCTQYMALCAKEKCKKEFMEKDFFEYKKYMKQGKSLK